VKVITCKCKTCKANAVTLGKPALSANIPPAMEVIAKTSAGRHGLVWTANDPSAVGKAARARIGVTAA